MHFGIQYLFVCIHMDYFPIGLRFSTSFLGAVYGDGVYFARDASYSLSYSKASPTGDHFMYLARVLVGKHTAGKKGMKIPPAIDPRRPEILYDSVVNREENPYIFVVFKFSCLPEILDYL